MLKRKEIKLGDAIRAMLRADGIETPLNEFRATEAWSEVMGVTISRYTGEVKIQGGIMYVQIYNAALRNELMMQRTQLVQRINQHIGAQAVQQIIFR